MSLIVAGIGTKGVKTGECTITELKKCRPSME